VPKQSASRQDAARQIGTLSPLAQGKGPHVAATVDRVLTSSPLFLYREGDISFFFPRLLEGDMWGPYMLARCEGPRSRRTGAVYVAPACTSDRTMLSRTAGWFRQPGFHPKADQRHKTATSPARLPPQAPYARMAVKQAAAH
jgi:hypothetical protein